MNDITLKKVQAEQLKILKAFKALCDKHGIEYILSSGTLLGAVRHKGVIPWDDDIDVDMTRENYALFLKHAHELGEAYFVQNWHTDSEVGMGYSKIRLAGTIYREEKSKTMTNNGIYIDVFPCDKFNPQADNVAYFKELNTLRTAILLKSKVYETYRGLKKQVVGALRVGKYALYSKQKLIEKYEALALKYADMQENYSYYEHGGANKIGVWILESKYFENRVEIPFEDDSFSVPVDYDTCLRSTYGDYMQLPPEDKRGNRHEILEVKFND